MTRLYIRNRLIKIEPSWPDRHKAAGQEGINGKLYMDDMYIICGGSD
jgi:hypothetical protein